MSNGRRIRREMQDCICGECYQHPDTERSFVVQGACHVCGGPGAFAFSDNGLQEKTSCLEHLPAKWRGAVASGLQLG